MNLNFVNKSQSVTSSSVWTGLPFKMVWASVLTGLVISVVITAIQLIGEVQDERDRQYLQVDRVTNVLASAAADAAFHSDTEKAKLVVSGVFEFPTVSHAKIITADNQTLFQKSTDTADDEPGPLAVFLLGENLRHELDLTVPGSLEPVGKLIVQLDMNQIADIFVASAKEELLNISFGILIYSVVLSVLFYLLIAKPLMNASIELRQWLENVDEDFKITIPKFHHNDELGDLFRAIDDVITVRRRLNNKLVQQQRAMDQHAIVSTTSISGKIIDANEKFIEISGYSKKELLGHTHRIVKSGEHTQEFYEDMWKTITSGNTWCGEVRNLKKNLTPYWVKATVYPLKDETGKIIQYISLRTDITDLKAREAEVLQFKSTLDSMADEIYMFWTDTHQIFYVNKATLIRTGLSEDAVYTMTPMDFCQEFEKRFLHDKLRSLIKGAAKEISYESLRYRSDGTAVPVETVVELIKPEGEKARFVAVTKDISDRLEIEKAKTEFISTVSHELRTPLTSIKGALGLIKTGVLGETPDKISKIIDTAYRNTNRLANLINDILDIEKAEAGMLNMKIGPVDMSALITEAVDSNKAYGDEYGVTFITAGIETPVMVQGDSQRLMQVLTNLMSNAAKFSNVGEDVKISVVKKGKQVRISITDTGAGIPAYAQPSIFDKFTQADSSDQRQIGGTGLGLSIAKSIVNGLGGDINFTSEVGKGTTFFFDLRASIIPEDEKPDMPPAGP